jgi:hypothetical protein
MVSELTMTTAYLPAGNPRATLIWRKNRPVRCVVQRFPRETLKKSLFVGCFG